MVLGYKDMFNNTIQDSCSIETIFAKSTLQNVKSYRLRTHNRLSFCNYSCISKVTQYLCNAISI